jgi:hypothetical protein
MAKSPLGELRLPLAGGKPLTLHFEIEHIAALQDHLDIGLLELFRRINDLADLRLSFVGQLLWAGLRQHHPEIDEVAALRLIPRLGGAVQVLLKCREAMDRAFPDRKGDGEAAPRPRKTRTAAGTGASS